MKFDLEQYDYPLPKERIALEPVEPRDHARLLVVDRSTGEFEHRHIYDLPSLLKPCDVLIANNTRVMKARLLGRRILSETSSKRDLGGKIEFLLLEEQSPCVWEGMFHAAVKHRPGVRFEIPVPSGPPIVGELIRGASDSATGTVVARFDRDPLEAGAGVTPLPPYIERATTPEDEAHYQTCYARERGSAAAPTAGLHFTPELIEKLRASGVSWEEITLHVGLGTFRPVKTADIRSHPMHEERYQIDPELASRLETAKAQGTRLIAVGTTVVRTLESAHDGVRLHPGAGRTAAFIFPGGPLQIRFVDGLLTNFHLPRSTLLMLVCAFAGRELVLKAYAEALRLQYRFFSYGDAMLLR